MTNPFNFKLTHRIKLIIIVLSIFLISLSLGLLVFGNNTAPDALNADLLKHGAEVVHITP
jgi:hypothetical protein